MGRRLDLVEKKQAVRLLDIAPEQALDLPDNGPHIQALECLVEGGVLLQIDLVED